MTEPGAAPDWDLFRPVLSTDVKHLQKTQPAPVPIQTSQKLRSESNSRDVLPRIPESQAEIEAWIAERKKRYPTQRRIADKEQDTKDREVRGALDLGSKPKSKERSNKPIQMSSKKPGKVGSFLDKLMEDEERRQRSIILQCFRYFRTHNFLQNEKDTARTSETDN
jgi:hypothetical protein